MPPTQTPTPTTQNDWWISLKHGGLLIAPSKLEEFFVAKQLVPLSRYIEDKLRRDVTRLQDGDQSQLGTLLDTVLEEVLGLSKDFWQKGTSVDRDWAQQAITREQIKPRRVWQDDRGAVLPVFVADGQDRGGQVARLGIGRGKRAVSRVIEWLRKADQKVALLTNGYQWRLIHAGADYDAWCEWDINLWFEEGRPGPQVTALRLLLGEASLRPEKAEVPSPLMAAIQSSRQGQAELSDVLGERVRKAVELLIRESSTALDEMLERESGVGSRESENGSELSGTEGLERGNHAGGAVLPPDQNVSEGGNLRDDFTDSESSRVSASEYRRGLRTGEPEGVHSVPENSPGIPQGIGNPPNHLGTGTTSDTPGHHPDHDSVRDSGENAAFSNPHPTTEGLAQNPTPDSRPTTPVFHRDVYIAASRIIMRCVVILFAEARDLLPRENPIYHNSYGIQGLREQLDRMAGGRASERLRNSYSAWPRMLALFRLVYEGSAHEAIPVPRYGGGLFTPGLDAATDPVLRALAALENPIHGPSDAVVTQILELLCRSKVKVRQGRRSTWVEAPVDFSDLSSEYIGILYEGLLDFELRRAAADDPMIFLNLGDQPALPLTRLEGMDDNALSSLVEKLKQAAKPSASEEEDSGEEDAEAEEEIEAEADTEEEDAAPDEIEDSQDDLIQNLRERAHQWAIRAVKAGKLVNKPRSRRADALAAYEQQVSNTAKRLIAKTILPGEWFLVRWGGTRKGSGTFYTRPQLAVPTVQRTLLPLAYTPPVDEAGEPDEMAPMAQWRPKAPAVILALKVCDPACGSASFLIASLRFLVEALWSSLFEHGWLIEDGEQIRAGIPDDAQPEWFVECVKNLPLTVERAEEYSKPRLKRYVVERCIYGVDINPLAVELGRLALWVETMDRSLAFSFLDHKVKCGNALIGCWFDYFRDYPALAWEREGGDKNHNRGVHYDKEAWTKAIKNARSQTIKQDVRSWIEGKRSIFEDLEGKTPEAIHDEALQVLDEMHSLEVNQTDEQMRIYNTRIVGNPAFQALKEAFNQWCAVWFWPADELEVAPIPSTLETPYDRTKIIVAQLAEDYRFFHWELEFPDVFITSDSGFDAVVGNPPWENLQPNPAEFFSNVDPLFRTYGRLEGLARMEELFEQVEGLEREWLLYCSQFKGYANWVKNAFSPFGDEANGGKKFPLGSRSDNLHSAWADQRAQHQGFSDARHPFRFQGGGRVFTYKLFLEVGHILLKAGGRFSLIVPSGIYSDKGTTELRNLFLNYCQWTHLYTFQNERFVFSNIHHSFKMAVVSVAKGGSSEAVLTRFRLGPGDSPEGYELEEDIPDNSRYLPMSFEQITEFSPKSKAFLEICLERDKEVIRKIYKNAIRLGRKDNEGWQVTFGLEFMMNTDAKLFPARTKWESKGYQVGEYDHWIRGDWKSIIADPKTPDNERIILSKDGSSFIQVSKIEDVALPLYQGVMISHLDYSASVYSSETGSRASWDDSNWEDKKLLPQFLIGSKAMLGASKYRSGPKLVYRRIAPSTNQRSMISTVINNFSCGDSLFTYRPEDNSIYTILSVCGIVVSLAYDYQLRIRLAGTNLSEFVVSDTAIPSKNTIKSRQKVFCLLVARLCFNNKIWAREWMSLIESEDHTFVWWQSWAITPYERLRLRCMLDALVAHFYELNINEFEWMLADCDYSVEKVCNKPFSRTLNPKGFWRVDKEKDPELRHTVLSLIAFHDLKRLGLDAFLNLNNGEGWMLPETLRLADYGLGHDERAQTHQPVAARIGAETAKLWESPDAPTPNPDSPHPIHAQYRFLPWQLQGTPADSWAECEMHAENLRKLLSTSTKQAGHSISSAPPTKVIDNQGTPLQTDLFGNPTEIKTRRKG